MESVRPSVPRLFFVSGRRRWLLGLAVVAIASGVAMLPAMRTMADHAASLLAFEGVGSVQRSGEMVSRGAGEAVPGTAGDGNG